MADIQHDLDYLVSDPKPTILASIFPIRHVCPFHERPVEWLYDEAHAEEHERLVAAHREEHKAMKKK